MLLMLVLGLLAPALADPRDDYLAWTETHRVSPHPEAGYRFYAEHHAQIAPLVAERPAVVTPFVVGHTVEDRAIWGFRLRDPMSTPRVKVLVFGNIHALEWVSAEVVTELLIELAHHPIDGIEVVMIPVLNIDRRLLAEADLVAGRDEYRRSNANGVDLNRDFAWNRAPKAIWRHLIPDRYAVSPAPLSQPESQAIDALAAAERFDVAISLHAFGGFHYFPWAGRWERPPDWEEFVRMGRIMEWGQADHAYRTRQLSRWGFFFRGCGMELDHLYGEYGTKAFLIEMTRSGLELTKPREWGNSFRLYNPVDPAPHTARGVDGIRALLNYLSEPEHLHTGAHRPR